MESNQPGTVDSWTKGQQAAIKEACSGGTPVSCQTVVAAMGSAAVWPFLPEIMATTGLIGAGANGSLGYAINGEINPNDVILGYWTGLLTANTGIVGTMVVNAGGGAASGYLKGEDPWQSGAISGGASGFGYGIGKVTQNSLDKIFNPMNPWKDWLWTDVGMGISKPLPTDPLPGVAGNIVSSITTEATNNQVGKNLGGEK